GQPRRNALHPDGLGAATRRRGGKAARRQGDKAPQATRPGISAVFNAEAGEKGVPRLAKVGGRPEARSRDRRPEIAWMDRRHGQQEQQGKARQAGQRSRQTRHRTAAEPKPRHLSSSGSHCSQAVQTRDEPISALFSSRLIITPLRLTQAHTDTPQPICRLTVTHNCTRIDIRKGVHPFTSRHSGQQTAGQAGANAHTHPPTHTHTHTHTHVKSDPPNDREKPSSPSSRDASSADAQPVEPGTRGPPTCRLRWAALANLFDATDLRLSTARPSTRRLLLGGTSRTKGVPDLRDVSTTPTTPRLFQPSTMHSHLPIARLARRKRLMLSRRVHNSRE
ncbi:unnamed protein product, partial [Protopolystoma xenopodis]